MGNLQSDPQQEQMDENSILRLWDAIPNRRLSSMAKEAWANRVIILRLWTWLRTLID